MCAIIAGCRRSDDGAPSSAAPPQALPEQTTTTRGAGDVESGRALVSTAILAGYFGAHAIWSVSDGEPLIPIGATQDADGTRDMRRFLTERLEDGVAEGQVWLAAQTSPHTSAVMLADAYVTIGEWRTDAIVIQARPLACTQCAFTIAVPYRHAHDPDGFAVYRPKLLRFEGREPNFDVFFNAFMLGVDEHDPGASIWKAHLDPSR